MTDFGLVVETDGEDGWAASLPHQCDRWVIAGDINYRHYASHEEAIQGLRGFRNEVENAFSALVARHTFGESTAREKPS